MKELESILWVQEKNCQGKILREVLEKVQNFYPEVIHSIENPVHTRGGIKILYGNLAPEGAISSLPAIPDKALVFRGKAKIYEGKEDALKGIRRGDVQEGTVIVIRNETQKESGMPEMYKAMKLLVGMNLGDKVCSDYRWKIFRV